MFEFSDYGLFVNFEDTLLGGFAGTIEISAVFSNASLDLDKAVLLTYFFLIISRGNLFGEPSELLLSHFFDLISAALRMHVVVDGHVC